MKIQAKKLHESAILPTRGSALAAGADLYALPSEGELVIEAGQTRLVHTGIAVAIPEGYVGLIYARSGLASKRHLAPANKVGVIDSDYRGEWMVALHNHSDTPAVVDGGERIAQVAIVPYVQGRFTEVDELSDTKRGTGGFGSTGSK